MFSLLQSVFKINQSPTRKSGNACIPPSVIAFSWSTHMGEVPPLEEDEYAEFYEINKPVIKFEGSVNEIQHLQRSTAEIAEEKEKDKV